MNCWDSLGIKNFLFERNSIIHFSEIQIPKDQRKSGLGTKLVKQLVSYADQTNQKIVVTPSTDYGATSTSRLKKFYKRFGFVENKGRNKDYEINDTMYRTPKIGVVTRAESLIHMMTKVNNDRLI